MTNSPHKSTTDMDSNMLRRSQLEADLDKGTGVYIETDKQTNDALEYLTPEQEALLGRAMRKVDLRLVPILGGLYVFSLVDRNNFGGARVAGLDEATDLEVSNRSSIAILVFYVGYVIWMLPSNLALQRVGPANWLSALCVTWGIVTLCVGFVRDWRVLSVLRVVLGCVEAGLFPGAIYLLSSWYRKYDYQKRAAGYYLIGQMISSFGNILAYGLTQIAHNPERDGWKWIFIVEGALTIGFGVLAWFVIPDMPYNVEKNKWLSTEEKDVVKQSLLKDRGDFEESKVTWKVIKSILKRPHMWAFAILALAGAAGSYSFLLFLPIIFRKSLGYSMQLSLILTAPPAAFATMYAFGLSWASDKIRLRGYFVLGHCTITIVGLCMIAFPSSGPTRFAGSFLGQAGCSAMLISANAWGMNNIRTDAERNVYSAWVTGISAIGGIYSALVFRQQDSPRYVPGVVAVGAMVLFTLILVALTIIWMRWMNRKADQGKLLIEGSRTFRYII
ncbi:hypothetical protein, variant 1 [Exophiala oligosperma]|uniref:Major facilitator superfamily (MFS) profile domain-containing protein n=2 Tax=Exophiala oligosperma TaxID=215243 RepID=A0A0D2DYB5_9EURO|nr:uncharacterized protein PV06_07694 [Exophiala oligosperma]XP_016260716.1 hypothetical protein, variant 1 [Exophiala oligosperma]KIW40499.1 hypothetical protein PV06_07694 [Exophiala oligosperma]KIW40500.1 hypothetical protein, variant 1 [Exophiala oligosperma]